MKIFIKPAAGLAVPDPERNEALPPAGREVDDSPYWRRRLRDKSVQLAAGGAEGASDSASAAAAGADTMSAGRGPGLSPGKKSKAASTPPDDSKDGE